MLREVQGRPLELGSSVDPAVWAREHSTGAAENGYVCCGFLLGVFFLDQAHILQKALPTACHFYCRNLHCANVLYKPNEIFFFHLVLLTGILNRLGLM